MRTLAGDSGRPLLFGEFHDSLPGRRRRRLLFAGTLLLTRGQAEPRLGQLEGRTLHRAHAKAGAKPEARAPYVIVSEVRFKVGEVFSYDGEVPKAWASRLIDLDAAESAKAKAVADEARREAERAANALAAQQTDELLAALQGITGDAQGNIDARELAKQIEGRINFQPTDEQLAAAWAAHVERLVR